MINNKIHKTISYCIAIVWLVNGFFCKVLNLVPRHQQIVADILGNKYARTLTILIGLSEIVMAAWIVSGIKTRLSAISQILIIAIMNTFEFLIVPDLLLWGRLNAFFAFLLILVIYSNEFYLNKKMGSQT